MTCYLQILWSSHWVLTSLGDLQIFECKEGRGSYNFLLLVLWFDVVGILYHSVL